MGEKKRDDGALEVTMSSSAAECSMSGRLLSRLPHLTTLGSTHWATATAPSGPARTVAINTVHLRDCDFFPQMTLSYIVTMGRYLTWQLVP